MAEASEIPPQSSTYGLRREVLSPMETLAQSISTIAPTTTPVATIPLVCALAGNGTWLTYVLASLAILLHNKVVVRAGTGLYYDRGELFTYLSPGFAAGVIAGGPFGVNQAPPFVNSQVCKSTISPYQGFIPTCDPTSPTGGSLSAPWGSSLQAPPTGNPADIINFLPSAAAIQNGAQLFSFAVYDRKNKLPYSINNTLDIQWQPRNDLLVQIGYVGNLGRHLVIPVPFNQAQIASPSHPIHGQIYSYGYTVVDSTFTPIALPPNPSTGASAGNYLTNYEGGNIDLRVPYVGYSSESE